MVRSRQPGRPRVAPCPDKPGVFRWQIQLEDGSVVHAPYAFATRGGADISADLWVKQLRAAV
ncbi:hypothetical protein BHAOGJBA_2276 [Methylobacterium hispanicum]|uniref:DUF1508 domain-containing protein n=1 Tax=Methylobacterium hispanicum TaxID=270350 RepID=A0AAV4ZLU5_9HYPH|nr:hypothetical protein BHAOGJBA_2276 [Methylobacterium hispanicum]